jgi:hypothetical protein
LNTHTISGGVTAKHVIDLISVNSIIARPILVTDSGITMQVKLLRAKAPLPMDVTELGITELLNPATSVLEAVSMIALQLSRESNVVFSLSTVTLVTPLQPAKAWRPIVFTELGIAKLVSPVQYINA